MNDKTISREELIQRITDPDIPLEQSLQFLKFEYDENHAVKVEARDELLIVDSDRDNPLTEANVAFKWVVKAIRDRRNNEFFRRLAHDPNDPILVLDGDSWAQHPFVEEIYEQIWDDYNVYCGSLAGRTMKELHDENLFIEMLDTIEGENKFDNVKAVILSGGGNDLFGNKMAEILTAMDSDHPVSGAHHIDQPAYQSLLDEIDEFYRTVINKLFLAYPDASFPIIVHSYSYLTPWDVVNIGLPKDKWIGDPMRAKGINALELQKNIIVEMVDQFHAMLEAIRADIGQDRVVVLDNRAKIPGTSDLWSDEIHPSSKGFRTVGDSIKAALAST